MGERRQIPEIASAEIHCVYMEFLRRVAVLADHGVDQRLQKGRLTGTTRAVQADMTRFRKVDGERLLFLRLDQVQQSDGCGA